MKAFKINSNEYVVFNRIDLNIFSLLNKKFGEPIEINCCFNEYGIYSENNNTYIVIDEYVTKETMYKAHKENNKIINDGSMSPIHHDPYTYCGRAIR